ncbi:MAG TPA: carboxylesterase/lipase family protein [Caulobacter sp.]|nr:carboxylesterase/lipase family protein [Caulobacter sp.]
MAERFDISRRALVGLTLSAAASPALAQVVSPAITAGFQGLDAGKGVTAYKGIPYARPPVGDLRFAPPQRLPPPAGRQTWTRFGPPAIQNPSPSSVHPTSELGKALQAIFPTAAEVAAQSEDCLYLNVWTTARGPETGRPVMVWLHGGGFAYGSGAWPIYDGTNLAAEGAVIVTLNHRLNVFGYADLPGVPGSGNAGMLDIVAALEWVRDNIYLFGGDPCNVTIFGESGGGAKVSYLLAMPRARGLFHRAIIQSGPGVKAVPKDRAAALTADLYAELGIRPGDIGALRAVPAERLVAAAAAAEAKQPGAGFDRGGFSPVADGDILPIQPWDPAAPATAHDVPVMIGINKDEMTLFMASAPWFGRLDQAGLEAMAGGMFGAKAPTVLAALKRDFPNDSPTYLATHLVTYGRMFAGSVQIAERKAAQGGAKAYMYLLEWETPVGPFRSPHTLEIPLVFDNVDRARVLVGEGPAPQVLAKQMSAAWLAFARTGHPNTPVIPWWPAYDAETRSVMVFNLQSRVVNDPYAATRRAVT